MGTSTTIRELFLRNPTASRTHHLRTRSPAVRVPTPLDSRAPTRTRCRTRAPTAPSIVVWLEQLEPLRPADTSATERRSFCLAAHLFFFRHYLARKSQQQACIARDAADLAAQPKPRGRASKGRQSDGAVADAAAEEPPRGPRG